MVFLYGTEEKIPYNPMCHDANPKVIPKLPTSIFDEGNTNTLDKLNLDVVAWF